jgi:hypothetical protein
VLGLDQPVGGLEHDVAGGVQRVVLGDRARVRAEGLHLRHGVEVAAGRQLEVDVHERLEPGAEAARRAPHALADRAHLPVLARQQGDDAVGLAQLLGAQHDRLVPVQAHRPIIPRRPHTPRDRNVRDFGGPDTRTLGRNVKASRDVRGK